MSTSTDIQWCDDTVNPVMGCTAPCELRPLPVKVRETVVDYFAETFPSFEIEELKTLLTKLTGDRNSTEIYQLRNLIVDKVIAAQGEGITASVIKKGLKAELDAIFICYAHQQHMMRGTDVLNNDKQTNSGFAPQFEQVTKFEGRTTKAALMSDLYGEYRKNKPWLDYLPRVIFVSDMADLLSEAIDFKYIKQEVIDIVTTKAGKRHIWLWLTKMPKRMEEFAKWLKQQGGSWPDNLVAMTTVTSQQTAFRVEQLLKVPAKIRGLSVEPLWEKVTLPLKGIDWCIVGGQSGAGSKKEFDLAWIDSLKSQCKKTKTALFVKQLGASPVKKKEPIKLKDKHGGDWSEWPTEYQIREMPKAFRDYR